MNSKVAGAGHFWHFRFRANFDSDSPTPLLSYSPTRLLAYSPTRLLAYSPTLLPSQALTLPRSYFPTPTLQLSYYSYNPTLLLLHSYSYTPTPTFLHLHSVLWIRNDLFRIRIQLWIFRVPDPGKSSGSMRIQIQPMLFKYIWKLLTKPP